MDSNNKKIKKEDVKNEIASCVNTIYKITDSIRSKAKIMSRCQLY